LSPMTTKPQKAEKMRYLLMVGVCHVSSASSGAVVGSGRVSSRFSSRDTMEASLACLVLPRDRPLRCTDFVEDAISSSYGCSSMMLVEDPLFCIEPKVRDMCGGGSGAR
jgi:hypothetical protein